MINMSCCETFWRYCYVNSSLFFFNTHTGYTGQLCELKLNLCLHSQYCITSHAVSCVDRGDNVTCTCADGWAGNNCGVNIDECVNHKCLNGAKCVDGVNGYSCKCRKGFTGLYCEGMSTLCLVKKNYIREEPNYSCLYIMTLLVQ